MPGTKLAATRVVHLSLAKLVVLPQWPKETCVVESAGQPMHCGSIRDRKKAYLSESVQTPSGAHLSYYLLRTGGRDFHGIKRPDRKNNHSSPICAEVKNMWSCTSISPYTFMT
jgi:hypothetical protein